MPKANNSLFQLPGLRKPAGQSAQQSGGQPAQSQPSMPDVDWGNTPQSWLQAAGRSAANNAINKFNNSFAGQMVGAYKRYRVGQAQDQTNDAMNEDMANRTIGQPNMNGLTTDNADSGQFSDTGSDEVRKLTKSQYASQLVGRGC